MYDTTGKLAVAATLETVTVWNLRKRTQVTWSTLAPLHGTRIASTFSVVVTTATLQAKRIDVESTCGETIVPRRVPPPCADVGCRQDECYGHGSQCCDRAPCSRVRPVGQTIGRTSSRVGPLRRRAIKRGFACSPPLDHSGWRHSFEDGSVSVASIDDESIPPLRLDGHRGVPLLLRARAWLDVAPVMPFRPPSPIRRYSCMPLAVQEP